MNAREYMDTYAQMLGYSNWEDYDGQVDFPDYTDLMEAYMLHHTWVPVEEDKPKKMTTIDVVIGDRGQKRRVTDCWYDGTVFCRAGDKGEWIRINNVTYWAYLPELP